VRPTATPTPCSMFADLHEAGTANRPPLIPHVIPDGLESGQPRRRANTSHPDQHPMSAAHGVPLAAPHTWGRSSQPRSQPLGERLAGMVGEFGPCLQVIVDGRARLLAAIVADEIRVRRIACGSD
jgi:hypothetical protein